MCNNYENNKKKKPTIGAVWPLLFYIFLWRNMNVSLSWPQGGGGATAQTPRWLRKLTLAENLQTGAPSYLLSLTLSSPWFTTHTAFICCCCHPRSAPARVLASFSFPSQLSVCLVHLPLETNPIVLAPYPRMTCANCPSLPPTVLSNLEEEVDESGSIESRTVTLKMLNYE